MKFHKRTCSCVEVLYQNDFIFLRFKEKKIFFFRGYFFFFLFQNAARMIKETMDKKFGASWHAVVGEGYGFEITHEVKNLLYMFFGGNMAIIVWKCS